jgi:hypothetical protein
MGSFLGTIINAIVAIALVIIVWSMVKKFRNKQ